MRVLIFNSYGEPSRYQSKTGMLGGWQDSLQTILMEHTNLELIIAFKGSGEVKKKRWGDLSSYSFKFFSLGTFKK